MHQLHLDISEGAGVEVVEDDGVVGGEFVGSGGDAAHAAKVDQPAAAAEAGGQFGAFRVGLGEEDAGSSLHRGECEADVVAVIAIFADAERGAVLVQSGLGDALRNHDSIFTGRELDGDAFEEHSVAIDVEEARLGDGGLDDGAEVEGLFDAGLVGGF